MWMHLAADAVPVMQLQPLQGFEWVNEGKNGRDKWGYVTWQSGSKLLIKVRSTFVRFSLRILCWCLQGGLVAMSGCGQCLVKAHKAL